MKFFVLMSLLVFGALSAADDWKTVTDAQMRSEAWDFCPDCSIEDLRKAISGVRSFIIYNNEPLGMKGLGFHELTDPNVPQAVQTAATSIFKVIIIPSEDSDFLAASPKDVRETIWPALAPLTGNGIWTKEIFGALLDDCEATHATTCQVPTLLTLKKMDLNIGSAFLLGSGGRRLITAGHVMAPLIKRELAKTHLDHIGDLIAGRNELRLYLIDSRGSGVVTPFSNHVRIVKADETILQDHIPVGKDVIELELEKPLSLPGIQPALICPNKGESVYALGFPSSTGTRPQYTSEKEWVNFGTRFPFRDSPGDRIQVTLGEVLEQTAQTITNADISPGMSGGPSLNEKGELIGVNVYDYFELRMGNFEFKDGLDGNGLKKNLLYVRQLSLNPLP